MLIQRLQETYKLIDFMALLIYFYFEVLNNFLKMSESVICHIHIINPGLR